MAIVKPEAAYHGGEPIKVRRIGTNDLRAAFADGLRDFDALRGHLLILGFIYPVVGLLVAAVALRSDLLPLLFPLVAGIGLLGPAVAGGFYELARRRERGEDARWRHFFDFFRNPSLVSIGAVTLVLTVLFLLWLGVAWGLYEETLGPAPPASIGDFATRLFTTSEGWQLIILGNLAGIAFGIIVLTISVVSFPMLVDRRVSALTAVETSFRAVARNPRPMALWGLMVAGLLVLGSLPLFVGLAVVLPLLGYATWHLYTRVVEP